LAVLGS